MNFDSQTIQWILLISFGVLFFCIVPFSKKPQEFFEAQSKKGTKPNLFLLTSSLVISWIFAKSITNAANLSAAFGYLGGLAYAIYYFSFLVGGVVIYKMRVKGGFSSIHEFLSTKYGRGAVIIFSLLIGIRLFNEVWSNTMVIGSYFGAVGTSSYYWAIIVFTVLTVAYTLKGGLRSSLMTDAIQMVLFAVLLVVILGWILPDEQMNIKHVSESSEWSWDLGLNLFFAALIQIFSYPFHDPVLTDRGFISEPKLTLRSYVWAGIVGFASIFLFSLIGLYAKLNGIEGDAAIGAGKYLGVVFMLIMNFIMITSAASTLDSTFSSFSKLITVDLGDSAKITVAKGRLVILALMILGTIPVFFNPAILSATTVSGTMVIGLAPIFLFWNRNMPRVSYFLSVGFGLITGLLLALDLVPSCFVLTTGKYAELLWANVWGTMGCFLLYFLPVLFIKKNV